MSEKTFENDRIRKYLLGAITKENELQAIEARMFCDDVFYEEILIEESELVQDYADGLLSDSERQSFEANYLMTEERIEKLRFAQALRKSIDASEVSEQTEKERLPQNDTSFTDFFKPLFSSPISIAFAAILLFALVGLIYWKQTDRSSGDADFLASFKKAYEKERPLESRIAGLDYAPIDNLRGGSSSNGINSGGLVNKTDVTLAKSIALKNVSQNPTPENHHALGQVFLAEKNFDQAIEELKKAIGDSPQNAAALNDLGIAYLEKARRLSRTDEVDGKLNLTAQALENINAALKLNSALPEARFNYALSLQQMGSTAEAKKAWREYLDLDADSKWADEARKNLARMEASEPQAKSKAET